jgi:acyl-CoA thioesterase-1
MKIRLSIAMVMACALIATGCTTSSGDSDPGTTIHGDGPEYTILAVGDSLFEYNSFAQASIPEVLGETIGIRVVNAAMSGAYFANPDPAAAADGLDVRSQYRDGDWEWVVVTGGGNDLNDLCGCGECEEVLDVLIAADGLSGEIPDFVQRIAAVGINVMLVGYYEVPSDADYGFDACGNEFAELSARLKASADSTDGVWFVSAADVITADQRSAYANDRVHPSIEGSKLVGEHIAAAIQDIGNA